MLHELHNDNATLSASLLRVEELAACELHVKQWLQYTASSSLWPHGNSCDPQRYWLSSSHAMSSCSATKHLCMPASSDTARKDRAAYSARLPEPNRPQSTRIHLDCTFEDVRCLETLFTMLVCCGRAIAALDAFFLFFLLGGASVKTIQVMVRKQKDQNGMA
jgi:hypothetical protein